MSGATISIAEEGGRLLVRITGPYLLTGQIRHSLREAYPSQYRQYSEVQQAWSFPREMRVALERWCDRRCSEGVAVAWEGRA